MARPPRQPRFQTARTRIAAARRWLRSWTPEILAFVAGLAGALLLIWAAAVATGWSWVWPLGIGLLLLGVPGYRLVGRLLWQGFYQPDAAEPDRIGMEGLPHEPEIALPRARVVGQGRRGNTPPPT